jgi:hypothetical protein
LFKEAQSCSKEAQSCSKEAQSCSKGAQSCSKEAQKSSLGIINELYRFNSKKGLSKN